MEDVNEKINLLNISVEDVKKLITLLEFYKKEREDDKLKQAIIDNQQNISKTLAELIANNRSMVEALAAKQMSVDIVDRSFMEAIDPQELMALMSTPKCRKNKKRREEENANAVVFLVFVALISIGITYIIYTNFYKKRIDIRYKEMDSIEI